MKTEKAQLEKQPPSASDVERDARNRRNIYIIAALAAIDGADNVLLPSCLRALEVSLGLTPQDLAMVLMCQGVAMAVSSPFWGCLADNGVPRRLLIATGAVTWGACTFALAFTDQLWMMIPLRMMNGLALGMLKPLEQSLVADMSKKGEMGKNFGFIECGSKLLGEAVTTAAVLGISQRTIYGMEGWRVAFVIVAILSVFGGFVAFTMLDEDPRPWTPERISVVSELRCFLGHLRIPTFQAIVVQGVFGCVPWAALSYNAMYLQYVGVPDSTVGLVLGLGLVGTGFGCLIGGHLGDWLAQKSRWHGRVICAQISVCIGIPIVIMMFAVVPLEPMVFTRALLSLSLGLGASWCGVSNRVFFIEIVPPDKRSSAYAWLSCIEQTSGSFFGPFVVAYLSQHNFGYVPTSTRVEDMSNSARIINAEALGHALLFTTVVPWLLCLATYSSLHFTYQRDVEALGDGSHTPATARSLLRVPAAVITPP